MTRLKKSYLAIRRILEKAGVDAVTAKAVAESIPKIFVLSAYEELCRKEELEEAEKEEEECPI